MATTRRGTGTAMAVAVLLAGCAHREPPAPPPAPTAPAPPPVAPPPAPPPAPTINSDLSEGEALWHLRAALNVAALGCGQGPAGAGIVARYNALLTGRKAVLATAYAAEKMRYGAERGALDRHMTQLYNFFADPFAQRGFCTVAAEVAEQAAVVPAAELAAFAPAALDRLERPVVEGRAFVLRHPAPPVVAVPGAVAVAVGAAPWRIQIGAFTGQAAAEAAWQRATVRVPSLAGYRPYYEPVPGKPLVRVQVGAATDRAGAIGLCAAAAAGGFDCMPVTMPVNGRR